MWWEMKDLENATGYKYGWLIDNFLKKQCYKKILDIDNGGFVRYPEVQGQKWLFKADRMQEFLNTEFIHVLSNKKGVS